MESFHRRETSREAYKYVVETGKVAKRHRQIYKALYHHGAMSAGETFEFLNRNYGLRFDSNTHARFSELENMGYIREVGKRPCRITGRTVTIWDVTAKAGPVEVHYETCHECGHKTKHYRDKV